MDSSAIVDMEVVGTDDSDYEMDFASGRDSGISGNYHSYLWFKNYFTFILKKASFNKSYADQQFLCTQKIFYVDFEMIRQSKLICPSVYIR